MKIKLLLFFITGWNAASSDQDLRDSIINAALKNRTEFEHNRLLAIFAFVRAKKQALFPDVNRLIVDFLVSENKQEDAENSGYTLMVTSAQLSHSMSHLNA